MEQGPDPLETLASLYAQSFGPSTNDGGVAVIPVNPQQQPSGGGISLGAIGLLAAVGVGGYFVYKKVAAR